MVALVRIEFIKATENRAVGDLMRVDKGSADALIGSGVARLADAATEPPKRKPRKPVPAEAFAPTEPEPADAVIGDDA